MAEEGQTPTNEILIGDETYFIPRFRGLKATLAGALIARVMRQIPELQDQVTAARKKYQEDNTLKITRSLAKTEQFAPLGLTDADFDGAENGIIELPEEPDGNWLMAKMFPDIFELADKEVRKFLALIVISNKELEDADDADNVEEVLAVKGKRLIREGDLDQLLELLVVGLEVLKEQMASKRGRLGKLQIPLVQMLLAEEKTLPETTETLSGETPPTEEDPLQPLSSHPDSSTDSPDPMDGLVGPPSMASPGTS